VKDWHTRLRCLRHEQQHDAADHAGDAADQPKTCIFLPRKARLSSRVTKG
jgi:hypothetical protein